MKWYDKVDFTEFFQKQVKEFPFRKMSRIARIYLQFHEIFFIVRTNANFSLTEIFSVKSVLKSNVFSKNVAFTKFFPKMRESKFL